MLEARLGRRSERLSESDTLSYRFRTPWLGLNQENHARYEVRARPGAPGVARARDGRQLPFVGQGIRSLGSGRIKADCRDLRPVQVGLKGVAMVGFVGDFRVNFRIPDHAGIGKSVSRGFGTVERVVEESG